MTPLHADVSFPPVTVVTVGAAAAPLPVRRPAGPACRGSESGLAPSDSESAIQLRFTGRVLSDSAQQLASAGRPGRDPAPGRAVGAAACLAQPAGPGAAASLRLATGTVSAALPVPRWAGPGSAAPGARRPPEGRPSRPTVRRRPAAGGTCPPPWAVTVLRRAAHPRRQAAPLPQCGCLRGSPGPEMHWHWPSGPGRPGHRHRPGPPRPRPAAVRPRAALAPTVP